MKPTRTWILVADGGRARILEALGRGKGLHMVAGSDAQLDNPPSSEQGRERPGRVYESAGLARHAIEPRVDAHRALERLFASQLAAMLDECVTTKSFDRLVLVAPPAMLGDLRAVLAPKVREKIVAEIDKDLTKVPNDKVLSHLEETIAL